jgi:Mor family transcriptional regulator
MTQDWVSQIAAAMSIESLPETYQDVAEVFGMEGALRLARRSGGMRIYVPKFDSLVRDRRDEMIRKEFTGSNHRELARKYGLSETWIREIVQRKPAHEQADLFAETGA